MSVRIFDYPDTQSVQRLQDVPISKGNDSLPTSSARTAVQKVAKDSTGSKESGLAESTASEIKVRSIKSNDKSLSLRSEFQELSDILLRLDKLRSLSTTPSLQSTAKDEVEQEAKDLGARLSAVSANFPQNPPTRAQGSSPVDVSEAAPLDAAPPPPHPARNTFEALDKAVTVLIDPETDSGLIENHLPRALSSLTEYIESLTTSAESILNSDSVEQTIDQTRQQILTESEAAVTGQSNLVASEVLVLLNT